MGRIRLAAVASGDIPSVREIFLDYMICNSWVIAVQISALEVGSGACDTWSGTFGRVCWKRWTPFGPWCCTAPGRAARPRSPSRSPPTGRHLHHARRRTDATAALEDPRTFLSEQQHPLVIDEIQLGGDRLVRAVKMAVDDDPTPGRFLLTGSTDFLSVPAISESLPGGQPSCGSGPCPPPSCTTRRASTLRLVRGGRRAGRGLTARPIRLHAARLSGRLPRGGGATPGGSTHLARELRGDGDEPRCGGARRHSARRFFAGAAATGRDAHRSELNVADWCRRLGIDRGTLESYLGWLRMVFLVHELPAWTRNLAARVVRRPKLHLADTGLAAAS